MRLNLEYKTSRALKNVGWESCQNKYGNILKLFLYEYPIPETAVTIEKYFPHKTGEITQSSLTSKLKMICKKFRQATDSGGKKGHGHIVLLYLELCKETWGGSPATTIVDGIETTDEDFENYDSSCRPESTQTGKSDSPELESVDSPETDAGITNNSSTPGLSSFKGTARKGEIS